MAKKNPPPPEKQYRVALIETGPRHLTALRAYMSHRATFSLYEEIRPTEREVFSTDKADVVSFVRAISKRDQEILRLQNIIKQYVDASSKVTQEGSKR